MVNKKAQDLSIGTLILIVLGIVVLVLLILGFSIGWSNLWEKIGIFGGSSSISDIVVACNLAGTSESTYDFCQKFHQIKIDGKTEYLNCQDSRVNINLNNKLNCKRNTAKDSHDWYCIELEKSKKLQTDTKVNGEVCNTPAPIDTSMPNPY
jgi:hypothetical protein